MKSLVIYFSKFGNTKLVADAIGEVLASAGQVRAIPTDQLEAADLHGIDLVVMGSPTHRMNLPQVVRPVFGRLPKRSLRQARVAAFDTSYKMSPLLARSTAGPKLLRKLRRLGGKALAPAETFHVMESEGPLFEGEIERAKAWAGTLLERVNQQAGK
jgi:flavodoxin